jgi:hypothetical protein
MSLCQERFLGLFQPEVFEEFRSHYEDIHADRPIETAEISYAQTVPLFQTFVNDSLNLEAFSDKFQPEVDMPPPFSGGRVSRSAQDCLGSYLFIETHILSESLHQEYPFNFCVTVEELSVRCTCSVHRDKVKS